MRRSKLIKKLIKCLRTREVVKIYRDALTQQEDALRTRLLDPIFCILCILHALNRMVEKMLQMILVLGMSYESSVEETKVFQTRVARVVDEKVMNRSDINLESPPKWHFPAEKQDITKIAEFTLSGDDARKFSRNFTAVVEVCTEKAPQTVKSGWLDVSRRFVKVFQWINSRLEFGYDFHMLAEMVNEADELCIGYFKLTGRDGNTNYWHALQAGHFSELLELYGNLYRYAQQGWENTNGNLSKSYHRQSQKGGGPGGSSKLLPLFESMTRGTLWRHGHLQEYFKSLGYNFDEIKLEYGKFARQPRKEDATPEKVKAFADLIHGLGTFEDIFGGEEEDEAGVTRGEDSSDQDSEEGST